LAFGPSVGKPVIRLVTQRAMRSTQFAPLVNLQIEAHTALLSMMMT
jgi:hypothetical protein